GTSCALMRQVLSRLGYGTDYGLVYLACIRYWDWTVFEFRNHIKAYQKYITMIEMWCEKEETSMNKEFKFYWISLIIGFDISHDYFYFPRNEVLNSNILKARDMSKRTSIPVPEDWLS